MKRVALCLALCSMVGATVGQTLQINVERPAYHYELLESVPDAVSQPADRKIINEFLTEKESARATFVERAHASCPELVGGQITVMDFATRLDRGVEIMNREISTAYEDMNDRLSPQGRSELHRPLNGVTLMSADTKAVAIAEAAPGVAESSFFQVCKDAGWIPPAPDSTEEE